MKSSWQGQKELPRLEGGGRWVTFWKFKNHMLGTSPVVLVGSSPCPPNAFSISSLSHSFFHLRLIFIAELFEYEGDSPQVKNILWLLTLAALPACNRWIYSYYSIEYDAWWGCPHTRKKSLHNLPSNRSLSDAGRPSSAMVWNGFPGRGMAQLSDLYSIFKYIFWCLG